MRGTIVYENWNKALLNYAPVSSYEVPVFTDAHIIGDLTSNFGPYTYLNAVAFSETRRLLPAIVVRFEDHLSEAPEVSPSLVTDESTYHGGSFLDELAALISLSLGIRAMAGNYNRVFRPGSDLKGQPIHLEPEWPSLLKTKKSAMVPGLVGEVNIGGLAILENYPLVTAETSVTIMRCARLYQEAMWTADTTPQLSWLLLVSAIETAAGKWRKEQDTPVNLMKASRPSLVPILTKAGGPELVTKVAEEIAPYMGATKTFCDFLLKYLPAEPKRRPAGRAQVDWNPRNLKKMFNVIYGYRSRALHAGTPFPAPLCEPAMKIGSRDGELEEKPIALAYASKGGEWNAENLPMYLHVFEYIARYAILSWWSAEARVRNPANPINS